MSQMQPEPNDLDYEPRFLPPEPDEMYDDTLWNERAWQPGWRPPGSGPRPPVGQPWPRPPFGGPHLPQPPSSPGKWPFWGYWGFRMLNAWRDIKFLRRLVADMQADMLQEAIKDGIVAPGPNSPVPGPGSGAAISGPILGVTDGSDAAPGQVGELQSASMPIPYPAVVGFSQAVSSLILPPGDWDVQAWVDPRNPDDPTAYNYIWGVQFVLQPVPTGASSDMFTANASGDQAANVDVLASYVSARTRVNVSTPTLLAFNLTTNVLTPGAGTTRAGILVFNAQARRVR